MGKQGNPASGSGKSGPVSAAPLPLKAKPTLTKEQEKQQAANAVPPQAPIFPGWTGKTPVSLLSEHCQKNQWRKPNYRLMKKPKGFQCLVSLAKEDKKTRQLKTIPYCPPLFYESEQEAKHFSATYALHKVASHLSLYRLLPPEARDLWQALEEERQKLPTHVTQYQYTADPFAAEEARLEEERKRPASSVAKAPREPWLKYPLVHMSAEQRQAVEQMIRAHTSSVPSKGGDGMPDLGLVAPLTKLGFREAHVKEALTFTSDHASALDWLCIHVPEDDLPPKYLPDVTPEINTQRFNSGGLAFEYAVKRLHSTGYSRKLCEAELSVSKGNEMIALVRLTRKLARGDDAAHVSKEATESSAEDLQEETEALESIFADQFRMEKTDVGVILSISFTLRAVDGENKLEIYIPASSRYPFETPGIVVRNPNLPAYILLSIQRGLAKEACNQLGSPMVYALHAWLEDNMERLVDAPPPLASIAVGTSAGEEDQELPQIKSDTKNGLGRKQVNPHSKILRPDANLSRQLKDSYVKKCKEAAYQKMLASRSKLPSFQSRDAIIAALAKHQVLIVSGGTGTGKSTQLGQFILENMVEENRGAECNIICTQPRRISALSLAERVSAERCERVGATVGYSMRGEASDTTLGSVSHVIVDEVHERGVDSDFLLIIIRDLLTKRPGLKLILMSATVKAETFSSYFQGAPTITIPGFTFPIEDFYLEDILRTTSFRDNTGSRRRNGDEDDDEAEEGYFKECNLDDSAITTLKAIQKSNFINYSLVAAIVRHICDTTKPTDGAILVFMPGVMEISKCMDAIRSAVQSNLELLPLHANLSSKEQSRVFAKVGSDTRKVVVATNIAETSITIDDVVFVIDSGKVKENTFNGTVLTLAETWASQSSCQQRRGRAGRVRAGQCYKLFSKRFSQTKMAADAVPEMLRIPLEQLCLQVLALGSTDVRAFLGKALDAPSLVNIENALQVLRDVNAIDHVTEHLTSLGQHMATIPADLRIAKVLLFGSLFRCVSTALTVAACMSSKSPFTSAMDAREDARAARERFASDKSDWLTDARAYHGWVEAGRRSRREARDFAEKNYMSYMTLSAISDLRSQYLQVLTSLSYVPPDYHERGNGTHDMNTNSNEPKIVIGALVAGLYPNLARVAKPDTTYSQTGSGAVPIDARARDIKFFTRHDGRVFIHPSSINFTLTRVDAPFLLFLTKAATSKVFLRDSTPVSAWPVLLFGGALTVENEGRSLAVDGEWRFQGAPRISALVNGIRRLLDAALARKIAHPASHVADAPVIALILDLVQTDGL
ncbi:hypothetical protein HKX48_006951 [Thoreauomyces humboldtii]|nr:hypothetical protein HKX48_006951 [Thoreauomyces humboldtii]